MVNTQTLTALDATLGVPVNVNDLFDNVVFCGGRTSSWFKAMDAQYPGRGYSTLADAISGLPGGDSSTTFGYNNSIIIVGPDHPEITSTNLAIVPVNKSGITIFFTPGAALYTSADLGANKALLEIRGNNVKVVGGRFYTTQASQVGSAIVVGNANGQTGPGLYTIIDGALIQGSENGSYKPFAKGIQIRDGKYSVVKNCTIYGDAGMTYGISIEAGVGSSTGVQLINNNVRITVDAGNAAIPLNVAAAQVYGKVIGGAYSTPSTAKAINIAAANWELSGLGLAVTGSAVGNKAQVAIAGATPLVGPFYVKQLAGATAASLLSEANI